MTKGKNTTICILLTFLLAAFAGSVLAGEKMTVVGLVTEDGLIVDKKGVIYEIGENDNFEAVTENTDVKVEVKGIVVEDDDGNKIIMIESFEVLK
ncbi:MAG: hypothetical protein WBM69_13540 [Desulfobacterales bacterium]